MIKQTSTILMGGSGKYTSPKCETIEFDAVTTICTGSEGTFVLPAWEEDDLGLNF